MKEPACHDTIRYISDEYKWAKKNQGLEELEHQRYLLKHQEYELLIDIKKNRDEKEEVYYRDMWSGILWFINF